MITRFFLKRRLLLLGCFTLFLIAWDFVGFAQKGKPDVSWQQSESISVQIGVRDKYGELGSYDALFVIIGPDGKQYKSEKNVSSDKWGYVYFPDNFSAYAKPGEYAWKCIVGGDVVTNGRFEYKTVNTYCDQSRVFR